MLGSDVARTASERGFDIVTPSSSELDATDPSSVAQLAAGQFGKVDTCINCSGYTAVDAAETNVRAATELNALAPGYLAKACGVAGTEFIHFSTDYVFDGTANEPYVETDATNPLGVYGATKLAGDRAALESLPTSTIFRTSWLYGVHGKSFPRTMVQLFEAGKAARVVNDQFGCPTYTLDLAHAVCDAIEKRLLPGTYHAAGDEAMSWHAFGQRVLSAWAGHPVLLEGIASSEYPTPAQRPRFSVLSSAKLKASGISLGSQGLNHFIQGLKSSLDGVI